MLAVLSVGLTLYVPVLIGNAIDFIIGKGKVDFDSVIKILFKILIIVAITGLLQWIMNVCNNRITFNVVRDMRNRAFKKIEVLPFSYLDSHSQGDTVSKVITDADQLADGLLMGFTQLFTGVATIIGTLIFMLSINFWITLVVVVLTPLSFLIARFIAKKLIPCLSFKAKQEASKQPLLMKWSQTKKLLRHIAIKAEYGKI